MTRNSSGPVPRQRLVDSVIARLEREIADGRFKPGDRLPTENELTALLGVSRTTLREAVGALAHAGLLDVRQGDGTYVRTPPPVNASFDRRLRRAAALEVYEVRRALELEAARLAAERRTEDDVRALHALLAQRSASRAAGEPSAFVEADLQLHLAVARASGNAVLAELYEAFTGTLRPALADVIADPLLTEDTTALHQALVDAIADRAPDAAHDAAARLLAVDAAVLRAAVDTRGQRPKDG